MELIWTQPGFKTCNQPLFLVNARVQRHLGISDWGGLYDETATPTLERYFNRLRDGSLRFTNPNPFRGHYRALTHRIVFKEIHGCADRINWFRDTFDARIVYLIRHPIAVAISSERFPLLEAFLTSDYRRHFSEEQLVSAARIVRLGTHLERGVLSWCLQNSVPLRHATDDWAIVTYEQLVVDPYPVIRHLAEKLELPMPGRMSEGLTVPSVNVKIKSNEETRRLLYGERAGDRANLIDKWRDKVGEEEEVRALELLELFELDLYRSGDVFPAEWAWIPQRPPQVESRTGAGRS